MTLWVGTISVCGGTIQRIPLSVLVGNSHKGHEEGGKEGTRRQSAWEVSQEKGAVSRREQQRQVGMRGRLREGHSHLKGEQRRQSTERKQGQRGLVSIANGFVRVFTRVHARVSSQNAQKVSQLPHSCAWSWPMSVFVRLVFCSTLYVVLYVCICKEIWNTHGQKCEKH